MCNAIFALLKSHTLKLSISQKFFVFPSGLSNLTPCAEKMSSTSRVHFTSTARHLPMACVFGSGLVFGLRLGIDTSIDAL